MSLMGQTLASNLISSKPAAAGSHTHFTLYRWHQGLTRARLLSHLFASNQAALLQAAPKTRLTGVEQKQKRNSITFTKILIDIIAPLSGLFFFNPYIILMAFIHFSQRCIL